MSYEKFEKNRKAPKGKVKSRVSRTVGIVVIAVIAVLLITAVSLYGLYRYYYGKITVDPVNTETKDLSSLMPILMEDINADVSGFPKDAVDSARISVLMKSIGLLPKTIDYNPIMDALEADMNADLSAYADVLSAQDMGVLRWIVYYEKLNDETGGQYVSLIGDVREIEAGGEDTSDFIPGHDKTDESGETTTPDDVTTPGDVTTSPNESTTPDVTTPDVTTPGVTTPGATTPSVTTPGVTVPGTTVTTQTEPPPILGGNVTDDDIYNVLILGTDSRTSSFGGRTDTIIIASINRVSKRVVLSSIMRDTILKDHEAGGYEKINAFYSRTPGSVGKKAGTLINAIKYNFDIDIDNYVVLNIQVFEKIVDIFGGVDVPLYYSEFLELKKIFGTSGPNSVAGLEDLFTDKANGYITVRLNAKQAERYVRIRSNLWNPVSKKYQRSDDSFRTERQRYVIKGLIQRVRDMSLDQLIAVANQIFPMVATDLGANDFLVKIMGYTDFSRYSTSMMNLSYTKKAWYNCKTDGYKVVFHGDPGYDTMRYIYTGVGILEPPYNDGYKLIKQAWRAEVYK